MHFWNPGQVRQRFGDCGFAGAGVAGQKQDMAAEIVCHVPSLTTGIHEPADTTVIGPSSHPVILRPGR
jgi:hypothetical protein